MRIAVIVSLSLISSLVGLGQEQKPEITYTTSLSGAELFKSLCATCHGIGAKGDGPAAAALKKAPADLTVLKKNNHGKFPTERVRNFIEGTGSTAAHGSREMPIWGKELQAIDASQPGITYRVAALASYIESIQVK